MQKQGNRRHVHVLLIMCERAGMEELSSIALYCCTTDGVGLWCNGALRNGNMAWTGGMGWQKFRFLTVWSPAHLLKPAQNLIDLALHLRCCISMRPGLCSC